MPLLTIPASQAIANVKHNPCSTWPSRGELGSRLEPLAKPAFAPSFRFAAGEKVFTVGSCFARNVEAVLEQCGFVIPTREIIKADPEFAAIGHNVLNNYGAPSILNEVRWALDPDHAFAENQAFFEIYPGKFIDVHLNHTLKPAAIEVVRARRRAITASYRAIAECRVVIVTLGLAECWYDRGTATYLNTAPRRSLLRSDPDRFELRILSHDEVLGALEQTLALVRSHGLPDLRVILTVSPVPLTSTYREVDVMSANTYSKAVLRTAAEALTLRHDFVDYFPSYESIVHSDRTLALQDDLVHPTSDVVWLNTTRMVRAYVGADALGPQDIRDAVAETPLAAIALLGNRIDLIEGDPQLALALLSAAGRAGRTDLIAKAVPHVGDLLPATELNVYRARVALAAGDLAEAAALLAEQPERRAARGAYWSARLSVDIAAGELDRARATAMAWSEANPRTPEPFRLLGTAYAKDGLFASAETMLQAALALTDEDPRILLDYADMLVAAGRFDEANRVADRVVPANPSHTERLARLRLWAHGADTAEPSPNVDRFLERLI